MAATSWPSPAHNSRAVDDIEYEKLVASIYGSALIGTPGSAALVFGDSSGRQVKFRKDRYAMVRGRLWSAGSTDTTVAVTANSSGQARIDLAVLGLDRSTWNVTGYVKAGTPGAGIPPALQQDTGDTGIFEIPCATIAVANGASTITAGNVTDVGYYLAPPRISCTSTTRPDHLLGLEIYESDTGRVYISTGAAWVLLGRDALTVDSFEISASGAFQTGISTSETNLSKASFGPVTVTNGDLYKFDFDFIVQSAANAAHKLRIRKGTPLTGPIVAELTTYPPGTATGNKMVEWTTWQCTGTETTTFYTSIFKTAGDGTMSVFGEVGGGRSRGTMTRLGYNTAHRVVA